MGSSNIAWRDKPVSRSRGLFQFVGIYLSIAGISILHYVAPAHAHSLHDIYRRLYYLPIILAAFVDGIRGGVIAGVVVCLAYAPHAFGHISQDPASNTQKVLEMLLYCCIGLLTGSLVSQLKGTQNELRGSLEQLRSTEEQLILSGKLAAVGRLSAGLAHEIRNPLASIKGSAEILAKDFPPEHPRHRLLQVLMDESVRLNHVLSRFLVFARPRPLQQQEIDMRQEVETIVSLLQLQQGIQSVQVTVTPVVKEPIPLRGDREQLHQVLLNILLNASQAAAEGGRVSVHCVKSDSKCVIQVHDSGSGFTPEAIENAFTPFFTTRDQGTGLGLALSHRIIDSHGGQIRVGNHGDGGGIVTIELPLQR